MSKPSPTAMAIAKILETGFKGGANPTVKVNDGPPLAPAEWVQHMLDQYCSNMLVALKGSEAILRQLHAAGHPVQVELREVRDALRLAGAL
jgi:hypothetical protein